MGAEVVGSAYVRIRALTKQLSKDIKDGVDKGIDDAKLDKSGEKAAGDFVDGFSPAVDTGLEESVGDAFENDEHEKSAGDSGDRSGKSWMDRFKKRFGEGFAPHFRDVFKRSQGDTDGAVLGDGNRKGSLFGDRFNANFLSALRRGSRSWSLHLGRSGDESSDSFSSSFFRRFRRSFDNDRESRSTFSRLGSSLAGALGNAFSTVTGTLKSVLGAFTKDGEKEGGGFGASFAKGFKSASMAGFTAAFKAISMVAKPALIGGLVTAVGPALVQSLVGITGLLGNIVTSAVGGAVAIAGAMTALLGFGPIIASFFAQTPELEAFKEEMKDIGLRFMEIGAIAQRHVLPALSSVANRLADSLIPLLNIFADNVGASFADFAEALGDLLTSASGIDRLNIILFNGAEGFRSLLQMLIPMFDVLLTFFAAASPLAKILFDDLNVLFSRMSGNMETKGIDALSERFLKLYEDFKVVMGGLADLTIAIYNILNIGGEVNGGFFDTFRTWAAEFRAFTVSDSGITKIQGIFENAKPVMSEVFGLLSDITKLIFSGATGEDGSNATVGFIQWLRNDAIPWMTTVMFPAIKTAVSAILGAIGPLAQTLGPILAGIWQALGPVVDALSTGLSNLYPEKLEQLGDGFNMLLEPLEKIGEALGRSLGSFFDVIQKFSDSGVLMAIVGVLSLFLNLLADILTLPGVPEFIGAILAIVVIFKSLVAILGPVISILSTVGGAIGAVLGLIGSIGGIPAILAGALTAIAGLPAWVIGLVAAAIVGIVYLIIRHWDTIKEFFTVKLPEYIGSFVSWLKDEFVPGVIEWFTKLKDKVIEVMEGLPDWIRDGIEKVKAFLATVLPQIPGMIADAFMTLHTIVSNALMGLGTVVWNLLKGLIPLIWQVLQEIPGLFIELNLIVLGLLWDLVSAIPGVLVSLGGLIVTGIGKALGWIVTEVPKFLLTVIKAFGNLLIDIPFIILNLGVKILAYFVLALALLVNWLATTAIPAIVRFFIGLPAKIGEALLTVGTFIKDKFLEAVNALIAFLVENVPKVIQFFTEIPGKIGTALVNFGMQLREIFFGAVEAVRTFLEENIPKVIQFFIDLPGKIISAITTFVTEFPGKFRDGMEAAKNFVITGIAGIVSAITGFIANIPSYALQVFDKMKEFGGKILSGIKDGILGVGGVVGDIVGSVLGGIKGFLNDMIGRLEKALTFKIGGFGPFPKIEFNPKLPRFAVGGIFTKATAGIMGEAGKEVLLPLTNPLRTYQLALESGLFDVLAKMNPAASNLALPSVPNFTPAAAAAPAYSGPAVVFQPGAVVVHAEGASADEAATMVADRIDWMLTSRSDR